MRSTIVPLLALLSAACTGGPVPGRPSPATGDPAAGGSQSSPGAPDPTATASADGGVAFERLDASPECDGIVPSSAPSPVVARRTPPFGATCGGGLSDGTGHVAVVASAGGDLASWQVFGPDGAPLQSFVAGPVAPQPEGWHAVRTTRGSDPQQPIVDVVAVAPDGSVRRTTQVSPDPAVYTGFRWSFGADPAGGSILLFRAVTLAGNHWHLVTAQRFAAGGASAFTGPARVDYGSDPGSPLFMGVGVSTAGDALAAWQSSGFFPAAWIAQDGAVGASGSEPTSSALGDVSFAPHDISLVPLLDGGLAVRVDGTFRRAYAHGETATRGLPAWLSSRPEWTFRFAAGGRAYAVFPPAGRPSADCSQSFDVISSGGRLCGRVTLHEQGTGCTTGAVDAGWDGTVVQQSARDACTYRWWPGLLAGR